MEAINQKSIVHKHQRQKLIFVFIMSNIKADNSQIDQFSFPSTAIDEIWDDILSSMPLRNVSVEDMMSVIQTDHDQLVRGGLAPFLKYALESKIGYWQWKILK